MALNDRASGRPFDKTPSSSTVHVALTHTNQQEDVSGGRGLGELAIEAASSGGAEKRQGVSAKLILLSTFPDWHHTASRQRLEGCRLS